MDEDLYLELVKYPVKISDVEIKLVSDDDSVPEILRDAVNTVWKTNPYGDRDMTRIGYVSVERRSGGITIDARPGKYSHHWSLFYDKNIESVLKELEKQEGTSDIGLSDDDFLRCMSGQPFTTYTRDGRTYALMGVRNINTNQGGEYSNLGCCLMDYYESDNTSEQPIDTLRRCYNNELSISGVVYYDFKDSDFMGLAGKPQIGTTVMSHVDLDKYGIESLDQLSLKSSGAKKYSRLEEIPLDKISLMTILTDGEYNGITFSHHALCTLATYYASNYMDKNA